MPSIPDDERPRAKSGAHVLGEDLAALSIEELALRVEALKAEIERIEGVRRAKAAQREAAATFFKR